jgi:membrane-associated PAP2 superfamily phosphatase
MLAYIGLGICLLLLLYVFAVKRDASRREKVYVVVATVLTTVAVLARLLVP